MKGYVGNVEQLALANANFRHVLYTDARCQLVVMSLLPHEDIGEEVHADVDQFLRIESGTGKAVLDGVEHPLTDGSAVIVPAGVRHNILNLSDAPLRLYTLYMPPHHRDGVIHKTKSEAEADDEHFDGDATVSGM